MIEGFSQKLKIIFQKRIIPVLTALMVLFSALVVSAPNVGAVAYNYNDYIQSIKVDGDNDLVTVSLPVNMASYSVVNVASGSWDILVEGLCGVPFVAPQELYTSGTVIRINPLGHSNGLNFLDMSNIPADTSFSMSFAIGDNISSYDTPTLGCVIQYYYYSDYVLKYQQVIDFGKYPIADFDVSSTFAYQGDLAVFEVDIKNLIVNGSSGQFITLYCNTFTLQMSISSLYRLQQEVGETNEILEAVKAELIEQGTTLDSVLQKLGVIESNQLDILSILRSISSDLYQWSARIWIDLNDGFDSVVEAISDGLSSGLDTLNNNVQNIITGGENGSELESGTNEMEQANDKLNGVVDKFDQANEARPTVPDDITTLIDPVQIDESVTFITSVFNYEAMGLDVLYPVLGLVAILAVLFYVLFGKAG